MNIDRLSSPLLPSSFSIRRLNIFCALALSALAAQAQAQTQAQSNVSTLSPISVTGDASDEAVRQNPPTTVGSKTALTQREIPQTISTISQPQIQAQGMTSVDDAMRNTPGVVVEKRDYSRSIYHSRGFPITSYQFDGVPTQYDWRMMSSGDLALYERVEVLKGPSGLYNGAGGLGGVINLVRKRPTKDFAFQGELGAGSWDNFRSMADISSPLNSDGSLRGRLVGVYQNRDFFFDKTNERHTAIYGIVDYDITPSTTVTLGGSSQRRHIDASMWSLPAYADVSNPARPNAWLADIPRSTFLGAEWSEDVFRDNEVFGELQSKFNNGWSSKLSARAVRSDLTRDQAYAQGAINPVTNLTRLRSAKGPATQRQNSVDAYVSGPLAAFGREHTLTFGTNFSDQRFNNDWEYPVPNWIQPVDVTNPVSDFPSLNYEYNNGTTARTRQWGLYANGRFKLADPLTLVAGGRVDWWQIERESRTATTARSTDAEYSAKFSPTVSLIYDINRTYALYGSYTEVFQPQPNFSTASGDILEPLTGKQYEVGIKGEYMEGLLQASLSAFQIRDENRAQLDVNSANTYSANGKTKSQGFELQASGKIQPNWNIYAGYTYTDVDVMSNGGYDSSMTAIAPKHLFRLWTDYRLPGQFNKFKVGGGVNVSSSFYTTFPVGAARGTLRQGGYATVDLMAAYQFTKNIEGAINAYNIFDRKYYTTIGNPNQQNIFGEPAAVMVTLRARY